MKKSYSFQLIVHATQFLVMSWLLLPLTAYASGPGRPLPKHSTFAPLAANTGWMVKAAAVLTEMNAHSSATPKYWLGQVSSDWNTAANWRGGVPAATDAVEISAGTPYYPVVATGTAHAGHVRIAEGSALTLLGGTLEVTGDFTNQGVLFAKGGTVVLTGPARQLISGSGTSAFYSLTVGKQGAVLAAPVAVRRTLTLQGDLNTTGQACQLLSDNAGTTATIVNAGGVLAGATTAKLADAGRSSF